MINVVLTTCILCTQADNQTTNYNTTLNFHGVYQFDSSITGGGKIESTRTGAELRIDNKVTDNDDLQLRFQFQQDDWDFTGNSGLGLIDPWDTINTMDFALTWTHHFNQETQWFVGGLTRSSYEEGSSTHTVGGGMVGVVHSFSPEVTLGGGVGVIGQIHDSPRIFPVIVIEWKINETVRLTTDLSTRFGSRTGVELEWTPQPDWSLGVGIAYDYSRFRLDDTGFAPNGAGEATSWPLSLRATYHASPSFDISLYGGIVFDGHLDVFDQSRNRVRSQDYDTAGMVGLLGKIRF